MQRLGHGAEIGHQPARHAGRNRERLPGLLLGKPVQISHGRRRTDGAKYARGMPSLQVVGVRLAGKQFGPDLIAHDISAQGLAA